MSRAKKSTSPAEPVPVTADSRSEAPKPATAARARLDTAWLMDQVMGDRDVVAQLLCTITLGDFGQTETVLVLALGEVAKEVRLMAEAACHMEDAEALQPGLSSIAYRLDAFAAVLGVLAKVTL